MAEQQYFEKLKKTLVGRVAVFIDAANLEKSVQGMFVNPKDVPISFRAIHPDALTWRVHYKKLHKFFKHHAAVSNIGFYTAAFDSEDHKRFLMLLEKLGFRVVSKPLKIYRDHTDDHPHRKANFDVEISVDAMLRRDTFDTIILFSGDCDFTYLLDTLRGIGKKVVLFSCKGHVAKELFPAVDCYFDVVDFRNELLRILAKNAKNPA